MANVKPIKVRAARKYIIDGTVDFDTDTFKVSLLTSTYQPIKSQPIQPVRIARS